MSAAVACTKCSGPLADDPILRREWQVCPRCGSRVQAFAFPAISRQMESLQGDVLLESGEAACFYHETRKASVACDGCGRFLCSLCDVDLGGSHLCPSCITAGKKKGKLKNLENRRTRYDRIALSLSLLPLLFWPSTILTAPATIFVSIRYWRAEGSILGRSRYQSVLAIIIALAQIAGWVALITYFVLKARNGSL